MIEDVIHDLFVSIWNRRMNISSCDNIRPYLLVSLRHALLKVLKRNSKTELKEEVESFHEEERSIESKIIEEEFRLEMTSELDKAYQVLSDRQKEAIFLRYMESMDYEDICSIMDINYQSVRNLISKGIKKLSEHFKEKNGI